MVLTDLLTHRCLLRAKMAPGYQSFWYTEQTCSRTGQIPHCCMGMEVQVLAHLSNKSDSHHFCLWVMQSACRHCSTLCTACKELDSTLFLLILITGTTVVSQMCCTDSQLLAGFNISLEPGFSPSRLCWMLAYGGIYAVANLRYPKHVPLDWQAPSAKTRQSVIMWCAGSLLSSQSLPCQGGRGVRDHMARCRQRAQQAECV